MKQIIYCTNHIPKAFSDCLGKDFEINITPFEKLDKDLKAHKNAIALLTTLEDKVNAEFINKFKNLKIISQYSVGVNNIDLECCKEKSIQVGNTPDVLTEATGDLALSLLFNISRLIKPAINNVKNGQWTGWEPQGFLGHELRGKTIGIYGMGRIGFNFAEKLYKAWDCKIIYHNRNKHKDADLINGQLVSFDELVINADIISIHAPLTSDNINIFNKNIFLKMKKDCMLINTARGAHINLDELLEILDDHLFGVGLDVTEPEPLSHHHPLVNHPKCIITPHIGSATITARNNMARICAENILAATQGKKIPFSAL